MSSDPFKINITLGNQIRGRLPLMFKKVITKSTKLYWVRGYRRVTGNEHVQAMYSQVTVGQCKYK